MDLLVLTLIGVVLLSLLFLANKGKSIREKQPLSPVEHNRRINQSLKALNKSFGLGDGEGPISLLIDGKYQIVDVGRTERMKDPLNAVIDKIAAITIDINDLESALAEANASLNKALVRAIENELAQREKEADSLLEECTRLDALRKAKKRIF